MQKILHDFEMIFIEKPMFMKATTGKTAAHKKSSVSNQLTLLGLTPRRERYAEAIAGTMKTCDEVMIKKRQKIKLMQIN